MSSDEKLRELIPKLPQCSHCGGTKESPMPFSSDGARCFDAFHDSLKPFTKAGEWDARSLAQKLYSLISWNDDREGRQYKLIDKETTLRDWVEEISATVPLAKVGKLTADAVENEWDAYLDSLPIQSAFTWKDFTERLNALLRS